MLSDTSAYFRIWTKQLLNEFRDLIWTYDIALQSPIIEISNSKKHLGAWLPNSRTIQISSYLISSHPWSVTLNVFKHEVAHQICSEIFNCPENGHGPTFHKACSLLGVPAEYRSATADLLETLENMYTESESIQTGRRFLERVEKLLSLAQSANEHEATLAMKKANELIEKYNVTIWKDKKSCKYRCVVINRKKKRIEGWQRKICSILHDFFFVEIIFSRLYDPHSNQTHKTIELFGTVENVAIAEHCYYFLENQLLCLWKSTHRTFDSAAIKTKNSYFHGILDGFYESLQSRSKQAANYKDTETENNVTANGTLSSLIIAEDQELRAFISAMRPRLKTISRRGPSIYTKAYNDGVSTGKKLILHKAVHQKSHEIRLISAYQG